MQFVGGLSAHAGGTATAERGGLLGGRGSGEGREQQAGYHGDGA